jgi:hypothetical protein
MKLTTGLAFLAHRDGEGGMWYWYQIQDVFTTPARSASFRAVTAALATYYAEQAEAAAYYKREEARGDLAFCPDTLPCWECGGFNGRTAPERAVVALGPVTNKADPTATYRLSCGHLGF